MSWIKDNQFMVALGGGTLAGVALLFYVGSGGEKRYESAKASYEEAASQASGFESLPLYPTNQNRDGKQKAIDEYRKSVESIQTSFEKFRPTDIKDVSPQDFTNQLKETNGEIRKAFEEAGTTVPEAFFAGFEGYKASLARPNATGMLNYQLKAIRTILLELAKAKPSEFRNLYRPNLPEEDGQTFAPQANAVVRPLPLEITFVGPEKSAREFLSTIIKPANQYVVIRALRITNTKKEPPKAADAQFDKPAAAKPAAADTAFGGGFVLPGDDAQPAAGTPEKAAATPTAPAAGDSSKILAQVLGNEQVQVFVRLDILEFLPVKKLP
ncbi:MAG: Amuc_1100 family pilus-like protein [Luteolibacter sp.]